MKKHISALVAVALAVQPLLGVSMASAQSQSNDIHGGSRHVMVNDQQSIDVQQRARQQVRTSVTTFDGDTVSRSRSHGGFHQQDTTVGGQTLTIEGDRHPKLPVSSAIAPTVLAGECQKVMSGAVQTSLIGLAFGVTLDAETCEAILAAQVLDGLGNRAAAFAMLCQLPKVRIAINGGHFYRSENPHCRMFEPPKQQLAAAGHGDVSKAATLTTRSMLPRVDTLPRVGDKRPDASYMWCTGVQPHEDQSKSHNCHWTQADIDALSAPVTAAEPRTVLRPHQVQPQAVATRDATLQRRAPAAQVPTFTFKKRGVRADGCKVVCSQ